MIRHPPRSTLFPYTTLSRSGVIVPPADVVLGCTVKTSWVAWGGGGVAVMSNGSLVAPAAPEVVARSVDRKSTRLNSSHSQISYAVFCLKTKPEYSIAQSTPPPLHFLTHGLLFFFFNDPAPTEIYPLSLHDALPIWRDRPSRRRRARLHGEDELGRLGRRRSRGDVERVARRAGSTRGRGAQRRSEEHTSELQSQSNLVCRLLLENKTRIQYCTVHSAPAPLPNTRSTFFFF